MILYVKYNMWKNIKFNTVNTYEKFEEIKAGVFFLSFSVFNLDWIEESRLGVTVKFEIRV